MPAVGCANCPTRVEPWHCQTTAFHPLLTTSNGPLINSLLAKRPAIKERRGGQLSDRTKDCCLSGDSGADYPCLVTWRRGAGNRANSLMLATRTTATAATDALVAGLCFGRPRLIASYCAVRAGNNCRAHSSGSRCPRCAGSCAGWCLISRRRGGGGALEVCRRRCVALCDRAGHRHCQYRDCQEKSSPFLDHRPPPFR